MAAGKYWNQQVETMPRADIQKLQLQKLKEQVKYCYENSSFYRKKFDAVGLKPEDIKTLADIVKIPFTLKSDLRDSYPYAMVTTKPEEIVEIHASSGTTGNPIVAAYTKGDLDMWSELMARCMYTTGAKPTDVIHVSYGYGLFTGGLGMHYGVQKLGARVVPASGGNTERQIKLMKDLGATILACTPSFAVYLAETMVKEGIDPRKELKLRRGIFGAEPWSNKIRERIEAETGMEAYDIYGLTELCGPGVSIECEEHQGLHVWEDHFIVETINPDTGEPVQAGEEGELVFTTLSKKGMPMLRYRTHDISKLVTETCKCGRTHTRMMRVTGRSDDMLIIRGVNVFPSQVEYAVMSFSELAAQYLIVVDRPDALDTFCVKVELSEKAANNPAVDTNALKHDIGKKISVVTGISADVQIVKPGELPRTEGKAKRVLDLRKGKM
jgi:phenylacetate-CoA ligase